MKESQELTAAEQAFMGDFLPISSQGGSSSGVTAQTEEPAEAAVDAASVAEGEMEADSEIASEADNDQAPASARRKRTRQNFKWQQIAVLEQVFETHPLPRQPLRSELAAKLGISQRCVQVWFQNRRQKVKSSRPEGAEAEGPSSARQQTSLQSSLTELEALISGIQSASSPSIGRKGPSSALVPSSLPCAQARSFAVCAPPPSRKWFFFINLGKVLQMRQLCLNSFAVA
mmetsp:Transcript_11948/g.25834  ORF Transcript_11948/g.25834 Transcript_11948/m.25834 type:complete len:230 (+) Transcript_11948:41-730(+)